MTKSLRQNPPGTKTPWDKNPMGQKPPIIIIRGFCPTFKIGGFCPRGLCPRGILSHTYIHTQSQKHTKTHRHRHTQTHTDTYRHTQKHMHKHTQTQTYKNTQRHTETHRHTDTQKHTNMTDSVCQEYLCLPAIVIM